MSDKPIELAKAIAHDEATLELLRHAADHVAEICGCPGTTPSEHTPDCINALLVGVGVVDDEVLAALARAMTALEAHIDRRKLELRIEVVEAALTRGVVL